GHSWDEEGYYFVSATVQDGDPGVGASVTVGHNIAVSDAPLDPVDAAPLTGTEGAALEGTVAAFADPNPDAGADAFTAAIDWGDGQRGDGTVAEEDGHFVVTGTHPYADESGPHPYAVSVLVRDAGGAAVVLHNTAAIGDAALSDAAADPLATLAG